MASFITAGNATNGLQVSSDNTGILELRTGTGSGTTAVTVNASQNVGLGVTPSAWGTLRGFQVGFANFSGVVGSQGMWLSSNAFYNGSNWIYQSNSFATFSNQQNGAHTWHIAPSGTAGNAITFTQAMTLTASGNFSLGTTTEAGRAYILGDGTNVALRVAANTATTTVYASIMRHESTTAGAYIQFVTDGNVETGRIYDLAGTMQYASSSDARLKTNVQPMQNSLQSVLALNPCTFDMRRGEDTFIPSAGLIAQEVHEVYPFVVGVGGDDENTNPWSVDYGKLTPLLVAAIKELNAKVEAQAAEIAALKAQP